MTKGDDNAALTAAVRPVGAQVRGPDVPAKAGPVHFDLTSERCLVRLARHRLAPGGTISPKGRVEPEQRRGEVQPYDYICKIWTSESDRFILEPTNQMRRINS